MKIKTSELGLAAIDFLVGNITGNKWSRFTPSNDWSHGGPIIEEKKITVQYNTSGENKLWEAFINTNTFASGKTPLVAAMRCFIASKLGDVVEVPEELI